MFADKAKATASRDKMAWKLLVVDDDTEVHTVTRMALRSLRYRDRPLEILSAYSGAEASEMLAGRDDVAIILLDVVMETDDAGLRLVQHIREELNNRFVRIILRTGQPGQAPEERVIVDYDINDYKAKTELTAQKLFTAILTALRAYDDIMQLEMHRRGLRQIIETSDDLFKTRSLNQFATGVLIQLASFLGVGGDGILCVQKKVSAENPDIFVLAATPGYPAEHGASLTALDVKPEILSAIHTTFSTRERIDGADFTTFYLGDGPGQEVAAYLHCPPPQNTVAGDLLQLFCSKIKVGFQNLYLYEQLAEHNLLLESKVKERTEQLEKANAALKTLATTDVLTGAWNRRHFMETAENEIQRVLRSGAPVSVIMVDIDFFKKVNDTQGHAAGDDVLKEFVARCLGALRNVDVLGRIGGEEFSILLPDTAINAAVAAAERIRSVLEVSPISCGGTDIAITASLGVAQWAPHESVDDVLKRADAALYEAKHQGRNRVVVG